MPANSEMANHKEQTTVFNNLELKKWLCGSKERRHKLLVKLKDDLWKLGLSKRTIRMGLKQLVIKPRVVLRRLSVSCHGKLQSSQSNNQNFVPFHEKQLECKHRNDVEKKQQTENSHDIPQQSDIQIPSNATEIASIGAIDASETYRSKIQEYNLSRTESSNDIIQDFTSKSAEKNSHIDVTSTNRTDISVKRTDIKTVSSSASSKNESLKKHTQNFIHKSADKCSYLDSKTIFPKNKSTSISKKQMNISVSQKYFLSRSKSLDTAMSIRLKKRHSDFRRSIELLKDDVLDVVEHKEKKESKIEVKQELASVKTKLIETLQECSNKSENDILSESNVSSSRNTIISESETYSKAKLDSLTDGNQVVSILEKHTQTHIDLESVEHIDISLDQTPIKKDVNQTKINLESKNLQTDSPIVEINSKTIIKRKLSSGSLDRNVSPIKVRKEIEMNTPLDKVMTNNNIEKSDYEMLSDDEQVQRTKQKYSKSVAKCTISKKHRKENNKKIKNIRKKLHKYFKSFEPDTSESEEDCEILLNYLKRRKQQSDDSMYDVTTEEEIEDIFKRDNKLIDDTAADNLQKNVESGIPTKRKSDNLRDSTVSIEKCAIYDVTTDQETENEDGTLTEDSQKNIIPVEIKSGNLSDISESTEEYCSKDDTTTEEKVKEEVLICTHDVSPNLRKNIESAMSDEVKSKNLCDSTVNTEKYIMHNATADEEMWKRNGTPSCSTSVNKSQENIKDTMSAEVKSDNCYDSTANTEEYCVTHDSTTEKKIKDEASICTSNLSPNNLQKNVENAISVEIKSDNLRNSTASIENYNAMRDVTTKKVIDDEASLCKHGTLDNNLEENIKSAISVNVKANNSNNFIVCNEKNCAMHDAARDKKVEDKASVYKYVIVSNNSQESTRNKVPVTEQHVENSLLIFGIKNSSKNDARIVSSKDISSTVEMDLNENMNVKNIHLNQNVKETADITYAEAEKVNIQISLANRQKDQEVRNVDSSQCKNMQNHATSNLELPIAFAHESTLCDVSEKDGHDISQNVENLLLKNNNNITKDGETVDQLSMSASTPEANSLERKDDEFLSRQTNSSTFSSNSNYCNDNHSPNSHSADDNNGDIEIEIKIKPKLKYRVSRKFSLKAPWSAVNTCIKNLHTLKDNPSFLNEFFQMDHKTSEKSKRKFISKSPENTSLHNNENVTVEIEDCNIMYDSSRTIKDNVNGSQAQQNFQDYPILNEKKYNERNTMDRNQKERDGSTEFINVTETSPAESSKLACDTSDLGKQLQKAPTDGKPKINEKQNFPNNTTVEEVRNMAGYRQEKKNEYVSFIEQKKTQMVTENNLKSVKAAYDTPNVGEQLSRISLNATYNKVRVRSIAELSCCTVKSTSLNASAPSESACSTFCQSAPRQSTSQSALFQSVPLQSASLQSALLQSALLQSAPFQSALPQSALPQSALLQSVPSQSTSQSVPPQSVPPQSVPPQSVPPQSVPLQSVPPQSVSPQSVSPQSVPPQSVPPQSVPPQSVPPQSVPPQSVPPQSVPPQSVPSQLAPSQLALLQSVPSQLALLQSAPQSILSQSAPSRTVPFRTAPSQPTPPQTTSPQPAPSRTVPFRTALSQPTPPQPTPPQPTPPQPASSQSTYSKLVPPQLIPSQLASPQSVAKQSPSCNTTVRHTYLSSEASAPVAPVEIDTPNIRCNLENLIQIIVKRICNNVGYCRNVIQYKFLRTPFYAEYIQRMCISLKQTNKDLQTLKVWLRMNDVESVITYVNQYVPLNQLITVMELKNYNDVVQLHLFHAKQILEQNNAKSNASQHPNIGGSVPNAPMPSVNAQPFSRGAPFPDARVPNRDKSMQSSTIPHPAPNVNQQQLFGNSVTSPQIADPKQSTSNIRQPYMGYVPSTGCSGIRVTSTNQQSFLGNANHPVQGRYIPSANTSSANVGIQQVVVSASNVLSSNSNVCTGPVNQGNVNMSSATNTRQSNVTLKSTISSISNTATASAANAQQQRQMYSQMSTQINSGTTIYPSSTTNQNIAPEICQSGPNIKLAVTSTNLDASRTDGAMGNVGRQKGINVNQRQASCSQQVSQASSERAQYNCYSNSNKLYDFTPQPTHRNMQTYTVQNIQPDQNTQQTLQQKLQKRRLQSNDTSVCSMNLTTDNITQNMPQNVPNRRAEIPEEQNADRMRKNASYTNPQQNLCQGVSSNVSQNTSGTAPKTLTSKGADILQTTISKITLQNDSAISILTKSTFTVSQTNKVCNFNLAILTDIQKIVLYDQIFSYFHMSDQLKHSLNEQEFERTRYERTVLLSLFQDLYNYITRMIKESQTKGCIGKDSQDSASQNRPVLQKNTTQTPANKLTKTQSNLENKNSSVCNGNLEEQSSAQSIDSSTSKNLKSTVKNNLEARNESCFATIKELLAEKLKERLKKTKGKDTKAQEQNNINVLKKEFQKSALVATEKPENTEASSPKPSRTPEENFVTEMSANSLETEAQDNAKTNGFLKASSSHDKRIPELCSFAQSPLNLRDALIDKTEDQPEIVTNNVNEKANNVNTKNIHENVTTLNNSEENDATLRSPCNTEDQNKEVCNTSNMIPSTNLHTGMRDDVDIDEDIEILNSTQSNSLNISRDSVPASSNNISISPIKKYESTEMSQIAHEESAETIAGCLNAQQEDFTNVRSNNSTGETYTDTSESSGKLYIDESVGESQEECNKVLSSKEDNLNALQASAVDVITCKSTEGMPSPLKNVVEIADTSEDFVIGLQNANETLNEESLKLKKALQEVSFEDEWNMGESMTQPTIKEDTKEEDNEQLSEVEEMQFEEMKFKVLKDESSTEESEYLHSIYLKSPEDMEKVEIDTHNGIKTINEQLKHVSEQKYYDKSRTSCNFVQEDFDFVDVNTEEVFAKNDLNTDIECISVQSDDSEVTAVPSILNIRSISQSLFEKIENIDTFLHDDLESLNEKDEKSLGLNDNLGIPDEVDDKLCLRCKRKSMVCCQACLEAHYCSKRCSSLHWNAEHYKQCKGRNSIPCINI